MRHMILVIAVIWGFLAHEAQAYEWSLGAGRMHGCIARVTDETAVCAMGPAMSLSLGLNVWGSGYRPKDHESSSSSSFSSNSNWTPSWNWGFQTNKWEEIVIVIALALIMTSVGYALLYPFSSRADVGVITRSGWQHQSGSELELWRNEAGIYMRAFPSQHFPVYLYGSGMFSYQNISVEGDIENHQVFVKGLGLGLMNPVSGGLYFHGIWERSTIIDPNAKDLIEDSGDLKITRHSVAGILDGSYMELGCLWHF